MSTDEATHHTVRTMINSFHQQTTKQNVDLPQISKSTSKLLVFYTLVLARLDNLAWNKYGNKNGKLHKSKKRHGFHAIHFLAQQVAKGGLPHAAEMQGSQRRGTVEDFVRNALRH